MCSSRFCASGACDALSGYCRTDLGGTSSGGSSSGDGGSSSGNGGSSSGGSSSSSSGGGGGYRRFPPGSPCYDIFDCVLFNQLCVVAAPGALGVCLNPCFPVINVGCTSDETCAPLSLGDGACLPPAWPGR